MKLNLEGYNKWRGQPRWCNYLRIYLIIKLELITPGRAGRHGDLIQKRNFGRGRLMDRRWVQWTRPVDILGVVRGLQIRASGWWQGDIHPGPWIEFPISFTISTPSLRQPDVYNVHQNIRALLNQLTFMVAAPEPQIPSPRYGVRPSRKHIKTSRNFPNDTSINQVLKFNLFFTANPLYLGIN